MKFCALVPILLLAFSPRLPATSFVDRDVKLVLEEAASVFEGRVVGIKAECGKGGCFSEVTVHVNKIYKGRIEGERASFCSSAPLSIGFKYVFFADAVDAQAEKSRCDRIVERDAIFSRFGASVYRYMSPGSFNTTKIDGVEYLTAWVLVKEFDSILPAGT
ncbi:hypothetical protein [Tahibacter harae]|uniref:Uncharacterized protein n=1 Tax=Tahibacter harae TaxID=2963937 RepID=A0ABT1QNP0_9GAMM|nr:hypothetical protein [Tahibacter harae]MCQ4163110.1 hypothetical protein [Tahibacter harae]